MAVAPEREARVGGAGMVFRWPLALAAIALLFLWLEIIRQLQSEWSLNPQYSYGWTVPFLALWLFYYRWRDRPSPGHVNKSGWTIALAVLAAITFLPARLIADANPDWRLIAWTLSLVGVVISLGAIQLAGGPAWLRHFAFPILFFLTAVPWPTQLEQLLVQSLMQVDTAITIQILNLFGTVAVQHGNVIELVTGQVGIDDACTGIRSLQATFMVALFLGEFYRMRVRRRVLLVAAGVVITFACNLGRTFILCQIAASSGLVAIHRWHDPAGITTLLICLLVLWGLSLGLKQEPSSQSKANLKKPDVSPFNGLWLVGALLGWLLFTEIAVATWYAPSLKKAGNQTQWHVSWPESEPNFSRQPIPAEVEALLRFNEGDAATWRSIDDRRWMMYSFRWLPGQTAALFVKNHRPDICLPARGLTLEQQSDLHLTRVNGIRLPILSYRFDDNGQPLHVIYCYWDGRSSYSSDDEAAKEDWTIRGRLKVAWAGRREIGARMLELAVWGFEDDKAARAALEHELTKVIRPNSSG